MNPWRPVTKSAPPNLAQRNTGDTPFGRLAPSGNVVCNRDDQRSPRLISPIERPPGAAASCDLPIGMVSVSGETFHSSAARSISRPLAAAATFLQLRVHDPASSGCQTCRHRTASVAVSAMTSAIASTSARGVPRQRLVSARSGMFDPTLRLAREDGHRAVAIDVQPRIHIVRQLLAVRRDLGPIPAPPAPGATSSTKSPHAGAAQEIAAIEIEAIAGIFPAARSVRAREIIACLSSSLA